MLSFLVCSGLWDYLIGPREMPVFLWCIQALGAVGLFLGGGLLASLVASIRTGTQTDEQTAAGEDLAESLEELAKDPERLIKWLKREEPVSQPHEDYFDMSAYARRMARLLRAIPLRTVGLIGPYGCGKSSILKMMKHYLRGDTCKTDGKDQEQALFPGEDIIVAEVSAWGFREDSVAQHILDVAISEVARMVDCLELASMPAAYQRAMSNSNGILGAICGLLGGKTRCKESLDRLDALVTRARKRLVIVLEDVDRNVRSDAFFNEITALLEELKGLKNISFVLAIGEKINAQEILTKLAEHIEIVPHLSRRSVLKALRSFGSYCLKKYPEDIDVVSPEDRENMIRFEESEHLDAMADARLISPTIYNLAALLITPRILKTSLRRTWLAWQNLRGEMDFYDLLVCNILRTAAPEAFFLINENVGQLRTLSSPSRAEDGRKREEKIKVSLRTRLDGIGRTADWSPKAVEELIAFLFPGWEGQFASHRMERPQGVNGDRPTDYWVRLNREELDPKEIRDQAVLHAIEAWKADDVGKVFKGHSLRHAIFRVDGFAEKVEQFGDLLDGKEVRDLATAVFALIRDQKTIEDARGYPGFLQLWHLSSTKEFDSHEDWIAREISRTLPVSLRFANDLYELWRHQSEPASWSRPTPELRQRVVSSTREVYGKDPSVFVAALPTEYPYSTYHLVVLHGSQREGGPGLENEDWLWFGDVLLWAAKAKPQVVLPHILVLLADYKENRAEPGVVQHNCDFNEEIAGAVFGSNRMRDLMTLLADDINLPRYNDEISARLSHCHGHALKWLQDNRPGQ